MNQYESQPLNDKAKTKRRTFKNNLESYIKLKTQIEETLGLVDINISIDQEIELLSLFINSVIPKINKLGENKDNFRGFLLSSRYGERKPLALHYLIEYIENPNLMVKTIKGLTASTAETVRY
jgi:hypothetical protein